MSPNTRNLLILSPIFPPASGGAATYYRLLTNALLSKHIFEQVVVLTERMPDTPDLMVSQSGRLTVLRNFPHRASASKQNILKYLFLLFRQNLHYLELEEVIQKHSITTVLVHTGFQNVPNLLTGAIRRLRSKTNVQWIGDVRDHQMPIRKLVQLQEYDRIIACSENVLAHLRTCREIEGRCRQIPVVQEALDRPSMEAGEQVLQKHGLLGLRYIVYVGLIKDRKGISLLLDSFQVLRKQRPDLHLVLAGILKGDSRLKDRLGKDLQVRYLGPVPRSEALALMCGSALTVNLSGSEGMPRNCLESLALGLRSALPEGIPEFEQYCPSQVVRGRTPAAVAEELVRVLEEAVVPKYPAERHLVENVIPMYEEIFTLK